MPTTKRICTSKTSTTYTGGLIAGDNFGTQNNRQRVASAEHALGNLLCGLPDYRFAKAKGLTVITVSSLANREVTTSTHSSGKQLPDIADVAIDNCVPPEDALVDVGWQENVAAGSTMAAVFISMTLVAEVAAKLEARGIHPPTFVSPNVPGVEKDHNQRVFEAFTEKLFSRRP